MKDCLTYVFRESIFTVASQRGVFLISPATEDVSVMCHYGLNRNHYGSGFIFVPLLGSATSHSDDGNRQEQKFKKK